MVSCRSDDRLPAWRGNHYHIDLPSAGPVGNNDHALPVLIEVERIPIVHLLVAKRQEAVIGVSHAVRGGEARIGPQYLGLAIRDGRMFEPHRAWRIALEARVARAGLPMPFVVPVNSHRLLVTVLQLTPIEYEPRKGREVDRVPSDIRQRYSQGQRGIQRPKCTRAGGRTLQWPD